MSTAFHESDVRHRQAMGFTMQKINLSPFFKKIIIWILLAESALILSTRLGAFLHEFVGHGLMAEFFGGTFEAFRITLFAGGKAYFYGSFNETASLCVSMGGIAVNLVIGILALLVIQKRKLSFSFTLFGIFFAAVSILSQVQYLILGAYYHYGDPLCLVKYPAALFLAWTGGLVFLAGFSLYIMRLFYRFQNTYFPSSHTFNRAVISLFILGIPILIYASFYQCSKTPLGSTKAIQEAQLRAQQEAERIKVETKSEKSIEEIKKEIAPYPILPWILAVYFLTSLLAFLYPAKKSKVEYSPPMPRSFLYPLPWIIVAISVLGLIAVLW